MNPREYNETLEIIDRLKRRKHKLELQRAQFGVRVDPVIETEIEDIDERIASYEQQIYRSQQIAAQPSAIPFNWRPLVAIAFLVVTTYIFIKSPQQPTANSANTPIITRIVTPIRTIPTMPPFEAQSWDQDGFVLRLDDEPTFYPDSIAIGWVIENKTQYDLAIPIGYHENFWARDSLGNALEMNTIACYSNLSTETDCTVMGTSLKAGYFLRFTQVLKIDIHNKKANRVIIQVQNIPRTLYREFSFPIKRYGG